MSGEKSKSKPLFPDIEWWKNSPTKGEVGNSSSANTNSSSRGDTSSNGNDVNYGSIPSSSSCEPIVDDDEEDGEPSFLIDKMVPEFPACLVNSDRVRRDDSDELGNSQLDVPSDISNQSSSDDDSSDFDIRYDSSEYEDEIEQPHRTLGLIFFDFLRFVAISVNVRNVNTQLIPVFLAWGRMDLLHIVLRIFMTLFSLLLILVEFPDLLPFLQHAPNSSTSPPPPLYIVNWIPRGLFYIFLSSICFEQSIVVRAMDAVRNASNSNRFFDSIFIVMSAWFLLVLGVLYITLGIFCIQRVMERVRKDEKEKWTEYYEKVHELELEKEEAEEREWLLENGGEEEGGHDTATFVGGGQRCWQKIQRWRRRYKRRRMGGDGGLCYQLGWRTVDWRC